MKYAICNETFVDWPCDRAFAAARECGYTGIEIAPFTLNTDARQITAAQKADVRKQAAASGLEVIGLHWLLAKTTQGFHLTTTDAAVRKKTGEYIQDLARLCRELGGRIMVFGSPLQRNLQPGVTHEQGMQHAAEVFKACVPTFEKEDVVLAIEPLGPPDGNFLNTVADGKRLMDMIGSPHCRLHLDCKAMATESRPVASNIREFAPWMEHFHANDPNKLGPGMGELDFVPIMQALVDVKYQGWVSVEVFDYSPGPEHIARTSLRNMQAALAKTTGS